MNILFIAHESGPNFNGASRSLLSLIDSFDKRHNVYVIIPIGKGRIYDELIQRNCQVYEFDFNRWVIKKSKHILKWLFEKLKWRFYYSKKNEQICAEIVRLIRDNNIQIVHSNSSVINVGAEAARLAGIPHVWHLREFGQEDFHMYPLCSKKEYRQGLNKGTTCAVAISKAVKIKYSNYIDKDKIRVIYNGINVLPENEIQRQEHSQFNVLISGMISKAKGQDIAIKAMLELIQAGSKDVHLYIAGTGDLDKLYKNWKEIFNYVHVLGFVDDMVSLRKKMDVEIVCSRSEAFGRVTIEAMAQGIPVIGTNSGGTPELIQDGVTGYLFNYGDYKMLAKKIKFLEEHRGTAIVMGKAAYKYAKSHFAIETCAKKIESLYYEIL